MVNLPIYQAWDKKSRIFTIGFILVQILIWVAIVVAWIFSLLDMTTIILLLLTIELGALVAAIYFVMRHPPIE